MTIKMTFLNLTASDFHGHYHVTSEKGIKTVKQAPGSVLKSMGGKQVLWVTQEFIPWYVRGNFHASIFWYTPDWQVLFGVTATAPLQFLTIGKRPYWGIGTNKNIQHGQMHWTKRLADQSKPYIWPDFKKFKITATPTVSHGNLEILVMISTARHN